MSYNPNPTGYGNWYQDPMGTMREALHAMGVSDYNPLARQMLNNANELQPMAMLYGANENTFRDFVNQYVRGQLQGGNRGMYSNEDVRNRAQSFINTGGGGGDTYEWMHQDANGENFMSMLGLAQRGMLNPLAQAQRDVYGRRLADFRQNLRYNMASPYQSFIDWLNGTPTPVANTGPGQGGGSSAAAPFTPPAPTSQPNPPTPSAGRPGDNLPPSPYNTGTPSTIPPQTRVDTNAPGFDSGQIGAPGRAPQFNNPNNPGGWDAIGAPLYGWTSAKGLTGEWAQIVNTLRDAQFNKKTIQLGNLVYDPNLDQERWWHGDPGNRMSRGESTINRITRWMIDYANGIYHGGLQPGMRPTDVLGALVSLLWSDVDKRKKGSRDHNQYGFWVKS